ncbi:MAG: DUF3261 domain-containing protein [Planctomycetota bacterium]
MMLRAPAWLFLAAVATAAGCGAAPTGPHFTDADYPGVLRAPAALGIDVVWQQRVTAAWRGGQQRGFDAAIQKRGDKLSVLGLSPTGSLGFAFVLQDGAIAVTNNTAMELPFPPRFILLDVQRAFYPWLAGDSDDGVVDGEHVVQRRDDRGRLVERRFRRVEGPPAGEIVVRYEWGNPEWAAPTRAELDNGWFGYRLTVDTHAETRLPQKAGQ